MPNLMDLPNETLEDIFHEALSPEESLWRENFEELNVHGWSRLNSRLAPIALSALLRHCFVVVGHGEDLLLEWLLASNSAAYFPLVKQLGLYIIWSSEDVLSRQEMLRLIARIPAQSSRTTYLKLECDQKFSSDDSDQLSSILADWNVTELEVGTFGVGMVIPQLPSVSYADLHCVRLNGVPTSFYTNIKSLILMDCAMDTTAEMRLRDASLEKLEWWPRRESGGTVTFGCLPPGLRELEFDARTLPAQQTMAFFQKLSQLQHLRTAILHSVGLDPSQWPSAIAALPNTLTRLTLEPYFYPEPQIGLDALLSSLRGVSHLPHLCQLHISLFDNPQEMFRTTLADTLRDELGKRGVEVSFIGQQ
jgi:hypothetical protein